MQSQRTNQTLTLFSTKSLRNGKRKLKQKLKSINGSRITLTLKSPKSDIRFSTLLRKKNFSSMLGHFNWLTTPSQRIRKQRKRPMKLSRKRKLKTSNEKTHPVSEVAHQP